MITMETDRLVDDYLRRLDAAAAHLQRSRRVELVAEIREHIEAALREEEAAGEAAVRNVLERLGPPEGIVDAAEPPPAPPAEPAERGGRLELAAIVALVVPLVGWIMGIVLMLVSRAWSTREKLVGIALALLPVLVPLLGFVAVGSADGSEQSPVVPEEPGPIAQKEEDGTEVATVVLLIVMFLAGLPSALYLSWRLRRAG